MRTAMLAAAIVAALAVLGCGTGEVPQAPAGPATAADAEAAPEPQVFEVRGRYDGPGTRENTIRISHEEVPGYMGAMTMDFPLADTAEAAGLEPGEKIRFRLTDDAEGYRVDRIEPLPPDTELQLEGGPA